MSKSVYLAAVALALFLLAATAVSVFEVSHYEI